MDARDARAHHRRGQEAIRWAQHLVVLYPLWMGDMPALLKGWFEQIARPGFALDESKGFPVPLLKGRSARVIVTMGMPGFIYKLWFKAHSLKSLERNILHFAGIKPVSHTIIGMVQGKAEVRTKALGAVRLLGGRGV